MEIYELITMKSEKSQEIFFKSSSTEELQNRQEND